MPTTSTGSGDQTLNIRDLPWFQEEDLKTLQGHRLIVQPDLHVVLQQAEAVFAKAREIHGSTWKNTEAFQREDAVRDFLRTLMVAFHTLRLSASNTTVYCNFTDANGNVCGAQMHITVDASGVYYECPKNRYSHVKAVP